MYTLFLLFAVNILFFKPAPILVQVSKEMFVLLHWDFIYRKESRSGIGNIPHSDLMKELLLVAVPMSAAGFREW